jgi:hypothetical protein
MGKGLFPLYHFTQKRLAAFVPTLREMVTKAVFPLNSSNCLIKTGYPSGVEANLI